MPARSYERSPGELRPVSIEPGFVRTANGSALYSQGETRVICTASLSDGVPRFLEGSGRGWVTAEYAMLPASTGERKERDVKRGRPDGRSTEIQRLIGRSLRCVVDFEALGERSAFVDCDVMQADGGTRCAAITGGYVALRQALERAVAAGDLERVPLDGSVAAVSVGMVDGAALCDLDYSEDSRAEVDANVVMTGDGGLVEVQATAERTPLSRASLDELLELAESAIGRLREAQEAALRRLRGLGPMSPTAGGPLVVATRNEHKLRELRQILPGYEFVPLPDEVELPPEEGSTFAENALGKARAAHRATGLAALADDSGIEAHALGGRPGVRSARYAGPGASDEQNLARLIAELDGRADRAVEYVCVIALVGAGGQEELFEGRCAGTLIAEPRGEGGFGYDPAFVPDDTPPDDGRTMAELGPEEKHAISHRGRAARDLAERLGPAP